MKPYIIASNLSHFDKSTYPCTTEVGLSTYVPVDRFIIFAQQQYNAVCLEPPLTISLKMKYKAVQTICKIYTICIGSLGHFTHNGNLDGKRGPLPRAVARNIKQFTICVLLRALFYVLSSGFQVYNTYGAGLHNGISKSMV